MQRLNILLVMPKVDIGYQDWPVPPVGILYVSAMLKTKGYSVYPLNLNLEKESIETVLRREITEKNINVVATGGLIVNYHTIKEILDLSKKIKNNILTCVGGSLVTFSAEAVMEGITSADIGMIGEGEQTACELINALEEGISSMYDLKTIKGLIVRTSDGELIMSPPREEIENLDLLPWPDYEGFHYFDMIKKFWNSDVTKIVSAPLTTSRSCPFNCTFCSKSGGEKYRLRSLDDIFSELDFLIDTYHVNRILLNDELFANDGVRIREFCERIKKYGVKWFVSLRVSKHITRELLKIMKESGCIQILYGLESGDDTVLKSMRKGITVKEIERVVHLTAEAGFQVRGNFIFGDPAETLETVKNTINFIENNINTFASVALSPIILFPGSALYKQALINGTIENELQFIESECPAKNVSAMSDDEYYYVMNELLPRTKLKLNLAIKENGTCFDAVKRTAGEGHGEYTFDYKCFICGQNNWFRISNSEVIMRANQYFCQYCQEPLNISITNRFMKVFYSCLTQICAKYKVALWGCGQNMAVINESIEEFKNLNYILVDTSELKIGRMGIGGKQIYGPNAILDFKIEFVIEMTSVRSLEILSRIDKDYPQVKYKYSMFDIALCCDDYL